VTVGVVSGQIHRLRKKNRLSEFVKVVKPVKPAKQKLKVQKPSKPRFQKPKGVGHYVIVYGRNYKSVASEPVYDIKIKNELEYIGPHKATPDRHHCHFIKGHPGSGEDWQSCGHPTISGSVYCQFHHDVCFVKQVKNERFD